MSSMTPNLRLTPTPYIKPHYRILLFRERLSEKCARDNPERYCGWFWILCSSKKFERMAREAMDVCLLLLKECNKGRLDSLQCEEVCWSYPILPFGIVACTFFPTTFLEISCHSTHPCGFLVMMVCKCNDHKHGKVREPLYERKHGQHSCLKNKIKSDVWVFMPLYFLNVMQVRQLSEKRRAKIRLRKLRDGCPLTL